MFCLSFLISFREPIVLRGKYTALQIQDIIKENNLDNLLIVTDKFLLKTNYFVQVLDNLKKYKINFHVFSDISSNPTITQVEMGVKKYRHFNCQGIISYGGGSVIDLAKLLGARIARPKMKVSKMRGTLKVLKRIPLLIAIPTTVGTGSEATLAAVISDKENNDKYAIMDPVLMPKYAILDVETVKTLPKSLIASTGMDALTHAIEAYIGKANTKKTRTMAKEAIVLIFDNLEKAYNGNTSALLNMQLASYKAGVAFTRAYVGNVHAIAHTLSGFYDVPHGLANAVILPYVLRYYGNKINSKLLELSKATGLFAPEDSFVENTDRFISRIEMLRDQMKIPVSFNGLINGINLDLMVDKAYKEANPLYPVPVIFEKSDFRFILNQINRVTNNN
jgi:alcohol dehydrogenase class IV